MSFEPFLDNESYYTRPDASGWMGGISHTLPVRIIIVYINLHVFILQNLIITRNVQTPNFIPVFLFQRIMLTSTLINGVWNMDSLKYKHPKVIKRITMIPPDWCT